MNYKEILKLIRMDNDLSQKDIANILGVSRSTYSEYEIELKTIPLKHLNTLCNYFGIAFDYVFGFIEDKTYRHSKNEISSVEVGKRLKEFRKGQKLTQVDLASVLNTVQPVIANYENGKNLIATPFLYDICKKYKVSADYLLGKIDSPKSFK